MTSSSLPSIDEQRERFFKHQGVSEQRLSEIIERRRKEGLGTGSYILGPGDEIDIVSVEPPELTVSVRVSEGGTIELPVAGTINVTDMSEDTLKRTIRARLTEFIRRPNFSVQIKSYISQRVSVIGSVRKPGTIQLTKGVNSVAELIGLAGGLTAATGTVIEFIPRELLDLSENSSVEGAIQIRVSQAFGTEGESPIKLPVVGGDVIMVSDAGQVLVDGEVEDRGAFEIKGTMTLLSALAAAGGVTYSADISEVEVIRRISKAERARLVLNLEEVIAGKEHDVLLRNGDLIRVPTSSSRRLSRDTFEGISRVLNIGVGGNVNLLNGNQ